VVQIFFTELESDALTDGKPFDAVAFGVFRDMLGREVEIDPDDADAIVANTQAAIEASATESGELVGLPIDAKDHDKGDAAGWIIGIEKAGDLIRVIPKWTEVGRELISKGIRRFFSGTINIDKKILLGGTLTNWPATRNEQGQMLLRPIEMAEGLFTVEKQEEQPSNELLQDELLSSEGTMTEEVETQEEPEVEVAPEPTPDPDIADLIKEARKVDRNSPQELVEFITKQADARATARMHRLLEENQRDWEITQLVAELTSNGERGLPVKPNTLLDFLTGLSGEDFDQATAIFKQITNSGLVEFTEIGHGRRIKKKQLPAIYHDALLATLQAGNSVMEFFEVMPELGPSSDYDLTQFEEVNNG
jgi:hypothetical protein